jgi:Fic family protein
MATNSETTPELFTAPVLDDREREVLGEIAALKQSLRFQLHEPRRWSGALRRMTFARNIQGSNSIEGFDAGLDDANAVALGEEPLDASTETRLALEGYRNAMTYVLQVVQEPHPAASVDLIKSLHFMMTHYDLKNRPGRWRAGQVFVQRERTGEIVHEGVDVGRVPDLMAALVDSINRDSVNQDSVNGGSTNEDSVNENSVNENSGEAIIRAAMAHLNLVMIHPFKDGNGRMARCLQSLVLAADGTLAPVFMSIEEHLGRNTQEYYDVLGTVGGGSWQPERDARPWIRFILTAHLKQAETLQRRVTASGQAWTELEALATSMRVPERTVSALFEAVFGYRVWRATYMAALSAADEAVSEQTATRDFKALVDAGLLEPHGDKRGRYYTAAPPLQEIARRARESRRPKDFSDPFAGAGPSHP